MIKLNKMCDHALVLMMEMCSASSPVCKSAGDWAHLAKIPEPTATKILKMLVKAGLCESQRGKDGGYKIAKEPKELTVLAIIEAIDGPVEFTECSHMNAHCHKQNTCKAMAPVNKIAQIIIKTLQGMTLAEMLSGGVLL